MPEPKRPLKVFLCHAHADRDSVRGLYTRLTQDGVDAWLDKAKLLPGQDWELEIRKAVREADVVVVCLSKQFNQAGFRQKEVRLALDTAMEKPEGEIFIIPARLEECEEFESLRKWHWVDLFEDDGYVMLMRALRARANSVNANLLQAIENHAVGQKEKAEKEQQILYKIYSKDIWDYIKDLPYMPSRADREKLFLNEEKRKRVKLWDYFFRIKPEDIGKPQREEIASIIKEIRQSIEECKQSEKVILDGINDPSNLSIEENKKTHFEKIDKARKRISTLKKEIAQLRQQVPTPLSGEEAREWLNREFQRLWEYTRTEVASARDVIHIQGEDPEVKNPLTVLGPGELQKLIPRQFLVTVNEDSHKHLGAKQAYLLDPKKYGTVYDVLYGVYFLEYIVVSTDMLVIHSFFYDFINDKVSSEYTTEQYYTDVVALAIQRVFRELAILDNMGKPVSVYVEDAPAFTLSLNSGETHQVTFVNHDYFLKVREDLKISIDDVGKIYWINQAKSNTDNVIKVLRFYLRKHKTL